METFASGQNRSRIVTERWLGNRPRKTDRAVVCAQSLNGVTVRGFQRWSSVEMDTNRDRKVFRIRTTDSRWIEL